ncbi:MAG: hypothetical protein ABII23_06525 [bacterium]
MIKIFLFNSKHSQKGMTVTELVIAFGLLSLVFIIASQFIGKGFFLQYNTSADKISLQRQARIISSTIIRNLRQAQNQTVTIYDEAGQPPRSAIAFTTINNKTFEYYQDGNKLIQIFESTNKKTLAEDLLYLNFSYPDSRKPSIIALTVTLRKLLPTGKMETFHLQEDKIELLN